MTSIIEGPDGSTCTDAGQPRIRILNEITVSHGREDRSSADGDGVAIVELDSQDVRQLAGMPTKRRRDELAQAIADGTARCGYDVDKDHVEQSAARIAEMIDKERLSDFLGNDLVGKIGITIRLLRFRFRGRRYEINLHIGLSLDEAP